MKRLLPIVLAAFLPFGAIAQEADTAGVILPAGAHTLDDFLWTHRPVIVFADTPADPRFGEQMSQLQSDLEALVDRDVIVLTDTDPSARSALRQELRPRGFQVTLVGKDGGVLLRKPSPQSVRELSRSIDKLPMRQQEVRDRRGDG
ncbi:MAG: DUF4174 domain-containing protein [Marinibacterium sp.]|nr:DUF4174 domain-containing protein [Marinibacterium sp.]